MPRTLSRTVGLRLAAGLITAAIASTAAAQVPRYGLSTRVELHMLPAVTSGPLDPDWRPDGKALVYSMRGDLWVQELDSTKARAITQGPGYHFEPAWSPNGEWIAHAVDLDGQLEIAVVRPDGSETRRLTSNSSVDVQPAWTPDSKAVFFATARSWDFDIRRFDLESGQAETIVSGSGHQFQPAVSRDGRRLAYVARVEGRLGSGGLWVSAIDGSNPRLVHYEETSYRPVPTWTPDGRALLYASDAAGSYDLATVPSEGGNRVRLTHEALDEFAPAVSPDGELLAFVANHSGPAELFVTSRFGGGNANWTKIQQQALEHAAPTATLRGRIVGARGNVVPARIQLLASDGRGYAPRGAFHRVSPANELHYFHSKGEFEVEVPAGAVRIEAIRGFEYLPADRTIEAPAGEVTNVELVMERIADPFSMGWVSGDTHVHDLHEGRYALSQEEFFLQLVADDLHVANDLIHMDGTKLMGRWSDLTGRDFEGSTKEHILRYSQEFRGSYGHVALLGLEEFLMPLIGGTPGSPYPADALKLAYIDQVREAGGIGGFVHPYTRNSGSVGTPDGASQSDIPLHVLLGRGDFYDVVSVASDEMASAEMYYHLLNVGARLPATGGTDNFSNVWRDPSGGTARTYALIEGQLNWRRWIEAVRAGRTMATNGPLLFARIDEAQPGGVLPGRDTATVAIELSTIVPVDRIEVLVDGAVVETVIPKGEIHFESSVEVPVAGARWVAVRAVGGKERYCGDNYAFAHTSPVYFAPANPNAAYQASAMFLAKTIEEIWRRVERRDRWLRLEDKAAYREAVELALARLEVNG